MILNIAKKLANIFNDYCLKHTDRDLYGRAVSKEIDGETAKEFYARQERTRVPGQLLVPFDPPQLRIPEDD